VTYPDEALAFHDDAFGVVEVVDLFDRSHVVVRVVSPIYAVDALAIWTVRASSMTPLTPAAWDLVGALVKGEIS
jgi:hypothetical protein